METYQDTPYHPFKEAVLDALLNKEGYLVELGTAADTVQIATSANNAIGVVAEKQEGNSHVTIRLLGKGGTVKVVAGGVIAKGGNVIWGTGGKVVNSATGNTIGRKLTQGNSADGDVIEIVDAFRTLA
ncbi:DUF2190 family protein [Luteolibacter luteus]|uniref:DUF2190 family protein n=1 Tax=Luteolibacter luteus TaxID=2728835 RepID=A0A858RHA7_9BACT|nr:DUF2190 family protein [Luteolibacter luteus]QJE95961.1 DUF2190 family protein [Luteolibacter luteus]